MVSTSYPYFYFPAAGMTAVARLYPLVGRIGLAFGDALVVMLTLLAAIWGKKVFSLNRLIKSNNFWHNLSLLGLGAAVLAYYSRVHFQMLSWLGLVILLRFLWAGGDFKYRKFLPLLFAFWVNWHAGFALGIGVLFLTILIRRLQKRPLFAGDVVLLLLSIAATFLNPYGFKVWREVWTTVSSRDLLSAVQEWMPLVYFINWPLLFFMAYSLVLSMKFKSKLGWEKLTIYFLLLLMGFTSQRHIPLWLMAALLLAVKSHGYLRREIGKRKRALERLYKFDLVLLLLACLLMAGQGAKVLANARAMDEATFYPREAVLYLRENLPEGQIFSDYGWGGYLIWKLPEKRVFLDGRMAGWRWQAPEGESGAAFAESQALLQGKISWQEVFARYGVDTVLWPVAEYKRTGWDSELQMSLERKWPELGRKSDFKLAAELEKAGWTKIYNDRKAVIYQKP
jgi:hypothetical protein